MNSLNSFKTNKFKKGDKVIRVGDTSAVGVEFGEVYTVDNPSSHSGCYEGGSYNHVTLVEVESTPSDKYLELYVEQRNYREMKPTDSIDIVLDGKGFKVPLGDLVHTAALLGVTNGFYGLELWKCLVAALGEDGFTQENLDSFIDFRNQEKKDIEYFFKPHYDEQKDELSNLILAKQEELSKLIDKLNQM